MTAWDCDDKYSYVFSPLFLDTLANMNVLVDSQLPYLPLRRRPMAPHPLSREPAQANNPHFPRWHSRPSILVVDLQSMVRHTVFPCYSSTYIPVRLDIAATFRDVATKVGCVCRLVLHLHQRFRGCTIVVKPRLILVTPRLVHSCRLLLRSFPLLPGSVRHPLECCSSLCHRQSLCSSYVAGAHQRHPPQDLVVIASKTITHVNGYLGAIVAKAQADSGCSKSSRVLRRYTRSTQRSSRRSRLRAMLV